MMANCVMHIYHRESLQQPLIHYLAQTESVEANYWSHSRDLYCLPHSHTGRKCSCQAVIDPFSMQISSLGVLEWIGDHSKSTMSSLDSDQLFTRPYFNTLNQYNLSNYNYFIN